MEVRQKVRLERFFILFAVGNVVIGAGSVALGLFGVLWGTLGQAGRGWQYIHEYGFEPSQELIQSAAYFWVNVCAFALGVGLILGASLLLRRLPWGRVFNLLVGAFGIGVCAVALFGRLVQGWSAVGLVVLALAYEVTLMAFIWHPATRRFWYGPPTSGEGVTPGQDE